MLGEANYSFFQRWFNNKFLDLWLSGNVWLAWLAAVLNSPLWQTVLGFDLIWKQLQTKPFLQLELIFCQRCHEESRSPLFSETCVGAPTTRNSNLFVQQWIARNWRRRRIMIRFCELAAWDHDLGSERKSWHHDVCGLFPSASTRRFVIYGPRIGNVCKIIIFSGSQQISFIKHIASEHHAIEKLVDCLYGLALWFMLKGWVVYCLFVCLCSSWAVNIYDDFKWRPFMPVAFLVTCLTLTSVEMK